MARSTPLRTLLRDLDADALREVLTAVCALTPQNRRYVELYLSASDAVDVSAALDEARRKLRACFVSTNGRIRAKPDLRRARELVREYERVLGEHPAAAAEVALLYVEAAQDAIACAEADDSNVPPTLDDALVRMYVEFARSVQARPALLTTLGERMTALESTGYDRRVNAVNAALRRGETDPAALDAALRSPEAYHVVYHRFSFGSFIYPADPDADLTEQANGDGGGL